MQLGKFVGIAYCSRRNYRYDIFGSRLGILTGGLSFAGFKAMSIGTAKVGK